MTDDKIIEYYLQKSTEITALNKDKSYLDTVEILKEEFVNLSFAQRRIIDHGGESDCPISDLDNRRKEISLIEKLKESLDKKILKAETTVLEEDPLAKYAR